MAEIRGGHYNRPTPKRLKEFGDALLASSTMITTYAIVDNIDWLALTSLGLGVVGKFMTNFFKDDTSD